MQTVLAIVKALVEAHGGQVAAALEAGRVHIRLALPVVRQEPI